jgi:outer membrane receptor for ferric coprogen and ferric-rhodotorulic acid
MEQFLRPKNGWKLLLFLVLLQGHVLTMPVLSQIDSSTEEEEPQSFELTAFEVTGSSRGYLESNSTGATALNTEIRYIPVQLEVISSELIKDQHATDMKEALAYSSGVFLNTFENRSSANDGINARDVSPSSGASVNNPFADSIVIRGYAVPNQQRLGFRVGSIVPAYGVVLGGFTDTANTERLEVVRGPQSLLYGINVLSGIVNILPKKPLSEPRTRIRIEGGDYGYYRGVFDHTGPIRKDGRLNYRIVASNNHEGDWTDYLEDESQYYAAQLDWKITPHSQLFLEAQYGKSERKGGGPQFFTDAGAISDSSFLNRYGENFTFGYDFFNEIRNNQEIFAPGGLGEGETDPTGGLIYGNTRLVERDDRDYSFPALGDSARLSGPDVFREQREFDFLALLRLSPIEDFDIELGAYLTEVDVFERAIDMRVFNDSDGTATEGNLPFNPEASANDPFGASGFGELFVGLNPATTAQQGSGNLLVEDRKYARYMWYEKPTSSKTAQLRARFAYSVETDWFGNRLPINHTFSGGINYIKDEISFINGGVSTTSAYSRRGTVSDGFAGNRFAEDPVQFRNIFDYSIIRYQGESLAIPGFVTTNRLTGIEKADPIAQSGWIDADLFYKGQYAVYHGRFWGERVNLILGVRQDAYQVREAEKLRIIDHNYSTNQWQGSPESPLTGNLIGYGNRPYVWQSNLPDSLNRQVEEAIDRLRENQPNGTIRSNFEDDQRFTTRTAGVSWKVFEPLSVFALYSEGVFPNTGQRDGAYRPIDAEQTTNRELGIKFDIVRGLLSGSVSAFQIKRKNAVWNWPFAPNPARWFGGPLGPSNDSGTFNPEAVRNGRKIRYAVALPFVETAFNEAGLEIPQRRPGIYDLAALEPYGISRVSKIPNGDPTDPTNQSTYFVVDYDALANVSANPFKRAMDLAIHDESFVGNPISYYGSPSDITNATQGSIQVNPPNVLYEEEGVGFDAQVFFTPMDNLQFIISYSHQERKVVGNGFQLAPTYELDGNGNPVDDRLWSTEYDIWVYQLGPENFEDPRDPTSLKGSAVNGIDLSFVPQDSARIWGKYTFVSGPLKGLSVGGGLQWNGPVPTTAGIGGERLAINRYPTPDLPERYVVDALLSYERRISNRDWTLSLKINNLFNDDEAESIAEYESPEGTTVYRRTHQRYMPINFRLALETNF